MGFFASKSLMKQNGIIKLQITYCVQDICETYGTNGMNSIKFILQSALGTDRENFTLVVKNTCKSYIKLEVFTQNASGQSCDLLNFLFTSKNSTSNTCSFLKPCRLDQDLLLTHNKYIMKCPCTKGGDCELMVMTESKFAAKAWNICEIKHA